MKLSPKQIVAVAIASASIASAASVHYGFRLQKSSFRANASYPQTAADPPATSAAVSALGYLRPEGEIIKLSAPTFSNSMGGRIAHLLVQEGDWVGKGEVVAVLDNAESLQAAVIQAEEKVAIAHANLVRVEAGAKTGELNAQRAAIARLQNDIVGQVANQDQTIVQFKAALANAQTEYRRYQMLFNQGAITASQLDAKQLEYTTAQKQFNKAQVERSRIQSTLQAQIYEAQATFDQISEVRPTDRQSAYAEIQSSIADVTRAEADLALAFIRAPMAGKVLNISARPGEVASAQGIMALGQTQQMNVVAEVYELDIKNVQIGQPATITSSALLAKLQGEVVHVGAMVNPQNIMSTDPVANVDQRVVEVKIKLDLDSSKQAASLTNLQVDVVISTAP